MHVGVGLFHVSVVGQKLYLSAQIVGFVVGVCFDEQISLFWLASLIPCSLHFCNRLWAPVREVAHKKNYIYYCCVIGCMVTDIRFYKTKQKHLIYILTFSSLAWTWVTDWILFHALKHIPCKWSLTCDVSTSLQRQVWLWCAGYCEYNGVHYSQDDTWDDGCDYTCVCEDAQNGRYQCTEKSVHVILHRTQLYSIRMDCSVLSWIRTVLVNLVVAGEFGGIWWILWDVWWNFTGEGKDTWGSTFSPASCQWESTCNLGWQHRYAKVWLVMQGLSF